MNPRSPNRSPASVRRPRQSKGEFGLLNFLLLAVLLILPVKAALALGWDVRWVGGYVALASLITYFVYSSDKRRAQTALWRIPEFNLHLLEFLGGWPGAWLAQKWLKHKCSKKSYQVVFAMIILIHQAVAYDAIQNWKLLMSGIDSLTDEQESSRVEVRKAIRL